MADSTGSGVSDACVFVSLALFGVWMQRQKVSSLSGSPTRWGAFFGAISGKYTIASNVGSSSSAASTSSSSTPAASTGSSATPVVGPGSPNPTLKLGTGILPNGLNP
jgi:hypothetical protein